MEIYQVLKQDHEEVRSMLKELLALSENDDYRHVLIETIAQQVTAHARAEEAVFYNTLRSADADTGIILDSFKEHLEAEGYIRVLQTKNRVDLNWKNTAKKLKEELEHHMQEEETKVFSLAQSILTKEEAEKIGTAFTQLKEEYQKQGVIQNSLDMVINMLPPRFANKIQDLNMHKS